MANINKKNEQLLVFLNSLDNELNNKSFIYYWHGEYNIFCIINYKFIFRNFFKILISFLILFSPSTHGVSKIKSIFLNLG